MVDSFSQQCGSRRAGGDESISGDWASAFSNRHQPGFSDSINGRLRSPYSEQASLEISQRLETVLRYPRTISLYTGSRWSATLQTSTACRPVFFPGQADNRRPKIHRSR
jgi:hypothetical protein